MAVAETRIWATRPDHQNGVWRESLEQLGYPVIDLPLMMIEPVSAADEIQAVKNLILDFDQFNKVFFVSQNAVHEAFAWLRDYWPQLPLGVEYLAVGSKTAEAVMAEGVPVVHGEQAMDTDELLALPELQNVWGQKVLICRGRGGFGRMGEVLQSRGAIVRYCELYHRRLPSNAIANAKPFLTTGCSSDVVPLFSGETLQNFVRILEANQVAERDMALVVPGKRVQQAADQAGFSRIFMVENATAPVMLTGVKEVLHSIGAP